VISLPWLSTATQNEGVAHDTDENVFDPSTLSGADQSVSVVGGPAWAVDTPTNAMLKEMSPIAATMVTTRLTRTLTVVCIRDMARNPVDEYRPSEFRPSDVMIRPFHDDPSLATLRL
jgi:hypothetical protein